MVDLEVFLYSVSFFRFLYGDRTYDSTRFHGVLISSFPLFAPIGGIGLPYLPLKENPCSTTDVFFLLNRFLTCLLKFAKQFIVRHERGETKGSGS